MHVYHFLNVRSKLANIEAAATSARHESSNVARALSDLGDRVEKLTLAAMALYSFLHEKSGVEEDQFLEKVKEIDLLDGVLDGKLEVKLKVKTCTRCNRVMSQRHDHCLYCGAEKLLADEYDPFR